MTINTMALVYTHTAHPQTNKQYYELITRTFKKLTVQLLCLHNFKKFPRVHTTPSVSLNNYIYELCSTIH